MGFTKNSVDNLVCVISQGNSSTTNLAVCANATLNGTTPVLVAPALDCNTVITGEYHFEDIDV